MRIFPAAAVMATATAAAGKIRIRADYMRGPRGALSVQSISMRALRAVVILAAALTSGACFHMTTILKANGDGSGTIEHTMLLTTAAMAQLKQMAALGGGRGQTFDPLSEQQAREMATVIGQGVTYVSSRIITTPVGQGREAMYAFSDVNQLKISMQPPTPAGISVKAGGLTTDAETVTFALTHESNGSAVLHIHVPEPNWLGSIGSANASGQLGLLKTVLAGAQILLAVEPAGALVRTSSPYSDAQRVTLLEVDVDEMMKDETLIPRLTAAKTQEEIEAIAKNTAGLKINLDREITVEFTPAK
jgi:hypothetical protein